MKPFNRYPGAAMDNPVLKVTPLKVLHDIGAAVARYETMGFHRITVEDDGCVGMQAGRSSVILASEAFMTGDFDADHVARLSGRTIDYIYVSSLDQVRDRLSASARVLQDVQARGGTREVLVDDLGDLFILAEKVPSAPPPAESERCRA